MTYRGLRMRGPSKNWTWRGWMKKFNPNQLCSLLLCARYRPSVLLSPFNKTKTNKKIYTKSTQRTKCFSSQDSDWAIVIIYRAAYISSIECEPITAIKSIVLETLRVSVTSVWHLNCNFNHTATGHWYKDFVSFHRKKKKTKRMGELEYQVCFLYRVCIVFCLINCRRSDGHNHKF